MSFLETKATEVKSLEWLKENVPSAFATEGSDNTSEKYVHMSTIKVLEDMNELGWEVVSGKEIKARKRVGFQKHLLILRNPDIKIEGNDGDIVYPQILLSNSSDATSSFRFTAGLFRLICENGLVVCDEKFGSMRVTHMGYSFEQLKEVINKMVEQLPLIVESLNKMKQTELDEEQVIEFATQALNSRFSEEQLKRFELDVMQLLEPTRDEDKGNDLWTVYNVIQEKLISGNFRYFDPESKKRKNKKARKIKNFNQDIDVNQKLYSLALDYIS